MMVMTCLLLHMAVVCCGAILFTHNVKGQKLKHIITYVFYHIISMIFPGKTHVIWRPKPFPGIFIALSKSGPKSLATWSPRPAFGATFFAWILGQPRGTVCNEWTMVRWACLHVYGLSTSRWTWWNWILNRAIRSQNMCNMSSSVSASCSFILCSFSRRTLRANAFWPAPKLQSFWNLILIN